jgi:CheY-like chemotaxis protein
LVVLIVKDSGTGMDEHVLAHLFEPFFTTKELGRGTGLGLATVYGIVRQSGGQIQVTSRPGEGSTFTLYLPRVESPGRPGAAAPGVPTPAPGGTETVLVVEDDEQVNKLAVEALQERGYRVLSASDGASALRTAETAQIDMLLTDVVLPGGMNGRELTDEMRRRYPTIKVLYMTGYTRNAIIHHGRLDPDIDLLTKPFTADALTRKVRRVLDGNGVAKQAGS